MQTELLELYDKWTGEGKDVAVATVVDVDTCSIGVDVVIASAAKD